MTLNLRYKFSPPSTKVRNGLFLGEDIIQNKEFAIKIVGLLFVTFLLFSLVGKGKAKWKTRKLSNNNMNFTLMSEISS